jgi:hypothetical protein
MAMYTIAKWEWYSTKPAPVFTSKKKAEELATSMRALRAWVKVIEIEENK